MKIGDYKQMMAYLTRPEQPKEQVADLVDDLTPGPLKDELTKDYDPSQESYEEYLQRKALGERPFNAQDGGRANLYAGGSLEKFASQIKDLHLKGISADKINEILKFEKDRSTTIDELIRSMIRGDAPITINAEELKRRPNLLGANKTGTPADRQEALKAYVDNFKKKNNRLPSKKELENAKFDFGTITKAVKSGNIEVLPSGQFLSMVKSEKGKQDILELSKDPEIRNIFKTGQFDTVNTINKVKEVLGDPNMSDNVAGTKIHTLAKYFSGEKSMKGINPTFRKNAELITEKFPYKEALRELGEIKIGESVGEQSLKTMKKNIRGGDFYSKARLSDLYNIDEVLGISSSVSKGTTPYGIFGQIIGREQNTKDKLIWDARKSKLEGALQEAIAKKSGVPEAVRNFNKEAKKYEEKLNAEKMRGAKKITLPRVSLASPNKTIANFKNFNNTYKEAFTDNFKQKGYSFIIPKDLKTIPELRDQVNDPKSDTYKQIINTLKKGFNESDEKKLFDKINKATPDALKKIIKTIPRIASVAGIVGLGLLASGQQAEAAGEETKTGSILPSDTYPSAPPSVLNKKEKTNLNLPPEAALAGAATYKYGPQLLKILKLIGKGGFNFLGGAFRTFGSPLVSSLYGASEILDYDPKNKYGIINPRNYKVQEDPDVRMAGLSLLLPDIAQKVRGPAATSAATGIKGFLSKAGRVALNPYFKAARLFTGGRVGFADGPEDPGKRKTMKILAGLASLPIVGRFFDVAQVAEKAAPAVVETFKNAPAHFIGLVNKIRALGRIIDPKKLLRYDKEKISNVYDYGDYRMYEKLDGRVEIQKQKWMATDYGDGLVSEEYMSYNPKTPKFNKKGEKIPDEYEEVYEEYTAYPDSEGKMKDIYESVEPSTIDEGTYSKEELEQLIVEQIEDSIKKGKK
jgi:hypothetical protein